MNKILEVIQFLLLGIFHKHEVFICMCHEMFIEAIFGGKSFVSYFPNMRLSSEMCHEMSIEVIIFGKSFVAYCTKMTLFTRMCT